MDEKLKADLDAIFAPHGAPAQTVPAAAIEFEDTEEAFVQGFYDLQAAVIVPAFTEIGEYIKRKGWDYRIDSQPEGATSDGRREGAQVTLRMLIGTTSSVLQDYEYPHFKAMCDAAARKVIFHQSTHSAGHGGSSGTVGQVRLEDVTVAALQEKLVEFVRPLFAG